MNASRDVLIISPGWGKLDPVECRIPSRSISIGLWWWSGNRRPGIKSEPIF